MSDTEEQKVCQTCTDFEPQTWRKSLCKNCFHTLEEHSAEILANEANAVAKEKAETDSEASSVQTGVKPNVKKVDNSSVPEGKAGTGKDDAKQAEDKDSEAATVKRKYGAARCAGEADGAWSWAKDLGRGFVKPVTTTSQDTAKGAKGSAPVPTISTPTSTKSSPPTSAKPSVKSTTPSTTEITSETTSTSSSSVKTTTTSAAAADTVPVSVSKAKNFASKFESKASALSKPKSMSKPPDIRPGGSSVAALTGKLTDSASSVKTKAKLPPEKAQEPQKLPKTSDTKPLRDAKTTESPPKVQKTDSVKAKDDVSVVGNKDSKVRSDSSKDKLSEKTSKFSAGSQSKAPPFGKDVLKSTKDLLKRDNAPIEPVDKKAVSPQAKHEEARKDTGKSHSTTSVSEKCSDNKIKKSECEVATHSTTNTDISQSNGTNISNMTVSSSSTPPDSKPAGGGTINNNRQLAKITGRGLDGKRLENSETKDHSDATKVSGGEVSEGQRGETNVSPSEPKVADVESAGKKDVTGGEKKNESPASVPSSPASREEPSPSTASVTTTTASLIDSASPSFTSQSTVLSDNKPKDIQLDSHKDSTSLQSPIGRVEDLEKENGNIEKNCPITLSESSSSLPQPESENNVGSSDIQKVIERGTDHLDDKENIAKLNEQLKEKDDTLAALTKQLSKMEDQVRTLEEERDRLQKESLQAQKDDMEKLLQDLRLQLSKMEEQCSRLDKDNQALIDKLHVQEASVKRDQEHRGKNSENVVLEEDLEAAEQELEEVKEENKDLQSRIMEMKNEMDEMYDHFREHDHDEFREIQKELDMTAKNCRILQFKLRKAERRNDQIEHDRIQYEEKLRRLQDQFDSQDAKDHIRLLEEELRMAKEVSVRLHDELDVVEDKRNKAMEDNKHLTELLEHTDKRQFRLEMEIDKLRDIVADLKQQLKEAKAGNNNNKDSTPDRKVLSSIYTRSID